MDEDIKNFPYPLDTDIEEQVPVRRLQVDSVDEKTQTAKFSVKTVLQSQTVRYIHAPKSKVRCNSGEHIFRPLNTKRGIFGCTNCQFAVKISPAHYMFQEGKLIHRDTRRAV